MWVFGDIMRMTSIATVLALVLGSAPLVSATASAAEPTISAPDEASERLRSAMWGALRAELHAPLMSVVVDTVARLHASADADGPIDVRAAARAALLSADFAGVSTRGKALLEATVDLVVLQSGASVRADLIESTGQVQAFRAIRKCAGDTACIDAIVPTETMTAASISYVNAQLAQSAAEASATKEKQAVDGNKKLRRVYGRASTAEANIKKSASDTSNQIISKL